MTLHEILSRKGSEVYCINPDATLDHTVCRLVEKNCGSLVVRDKNNSQPMIGIITERDILRACCAEGRAYGNVKVSDVMTRDVVTGSPSDSVNDTMGLMTRKRIRHLPVVESGMLVGMISIGDIVKAQSDRLQLENHCLKSYIQGDSVLARHDETN